MVSLCYKWKFTTTEYKGRRFGEVGFLSSYKDSLRLGFAWQSISAEGDIGLICKCFHFIQHPLHGRSCWGNQQHISSIAYRTHEETSNMGPKTKIMKALEWGISIN